jgi:DegV family protein with EDD domain
MQKPYIITTDSGVSLPLSCKLGSENIIDVPIFCGSKSEPVENSKLTTDNLIEWMAAGKAFRSGASNIYEFADFFEQFLSKGLDIIHISLSGELGSTYNNAKLVADALLDNYKGRRITVIDSRNVSCGQGLLVHEAVEMQVEGQSYASVVTEINKLRMHTSFLFTLYDLSYMHKNGRLDKASKVLGSILGVRPIVKMRGGKFELDHKVRGKKNAVTHLKDMAASLMLLKSRTVFLEYINAYTDSSMAESLEKEIRITLSNFDVKPKIYVMQSCPLSVVQCGTRGIGVSFVTSERGGLNG